jgi:hypothetical protein
VDFTFVSALAPYALAAQTRVAVGRRRAPTFDTHAGKSSRPWPSSGAATTESAQ